MAPKAPVFVLKKCEMSRNMRSILVELLADLVVTNAHNRTSMFAVLPGQLCNGMAAAYGPGWCCVIGRKLALNVRYMKGTYAFFTTTNGSKVTCVTIFKCSADSTSLPSATSDSEPATAGTAAGAVEIVQSFKPINSVTGSSSYKIIEKLINQNASRFPESDDAFVVAVKQDIVAKLGTTWQIAMANPEITYSVSSTSDEEQFHGRIVGRGSSILIWRSLDPVKHKIDTGDVSSQSICGTANFRSIGLLVAAILFAVYLVLGIACDMSCASPDKPTVMPTLTDDGMAVESDMPAPTEERWSAGGSPCTDALTQQADQCARWSRTLLLVAAMVFAASPAAAAIQKRFQNKEKDD